MSSGTIWSEAGGVAVVTPAAPAAAPDPAGEVALEAGRASGLVLPTVAPRRRQPPKARVLLRVVVPLLIVALWWGLTGSGLVQPQVLSSPAGTWSTFWNLLTHQDLLGDVGVSLARAAVGLLIGGGLGLIFGVIVGLYRLADELVDSTVQMFRLIPFPAVIFLFIVWFGVGETPKVLLIALATLFPMYINTVNGVRNVDRRVVEAARSFGLRGFQLVRQVVLPLSLPSILTGLRFAAGISIIALVFAETINANKGIGYLVTQASSFNQTSVLVVCILVYALLGIVVDVVVRLIERFSMPWRRQLAIR